MLDAAPSPTATAISSRQLLVRMLVCGAAAVAVQPLVFLALLADALLLSSTPLAGLGFVLSAVAVVAAAAVGLLGIPAFMLLRKFRRDSWGWVCATGALIAALPVALFWPRRMDGFSAGNNWHGTYVDTYVNGVPTVYAWLQHGEQILWFAIHGLIGALVFYAAWRRLGRGTGRI